MYGYDFYVKVSQISKTVGLLLHLSRCSVDVLTVLKMKNKWNIHNNCLFHNISLSLFQKKICCNVFTIYFCVFLTVLLSEQFWFFNHFLLQLTLEKHGFELHRSTYMGSFSIVHDPWLVDSMDTELQIQRADYKIIHKVDL